MGKDCPRWPEGKDWHRLTFLSFVYVIYDIDIIFCLVKHFLFIAIILYCNTSNCLSLWTD